MNWGYLPLACLLIQSHSLLGRSGDRAHLRWGFDWKSVRLHRVGINECDHHLHASQPMFASKLDGVLRVAKINGFAQLSRPGSGATKIQ